MKNPDARGFRPLRVLVSEGSSTSAREAVTVLGLSGHLVEICDPDRRALARFSRFVRKFHRCPGLRDRPTAYLAFVERLLATKRFDVLLPIHEQGFLFARVRHRLAASVGLALPEFGNYRRAHNKADFSRLLREIGLPQPNTRIVAAASELRGSLRYPCVVKAAIGTASRAVWIVRDDHDATKALQDLPGDDGPAGEWLLQDFIEGATEKAQAVFSRGALIGFHAYRQIAAGAGGGDAVKRSVGRAGVRADVAEIGRHLEWHGALSVDYIMPASGAGPLYIDCNPRLVEPMSAYLAGVDLIGALLRISIGETPQPLPDGREGVTTHQAMQALLGCALGGGNRRAIARECFQLYARTGIYAGSIEELTPVRLDRLSALPLVMMALLLLASPKLARTLATRGWGAHLLTRHSIAQIEKGVVGD